MIEFVRKENSPFCDSIEERMREMSLSYTARIAGRSGGPQKDDPEPEEAPLIIDEGKIIKGEEEIYRYLDEMREFKKKWDKFQSDACYCDDEGKIE